MNDNTFRILEMAERGARFQNVPAELRESDDFRYWREVVSFFTVTPAGLLALTGPGQQALMRETLLRTMKQEAPQPVSVRVMNQAETETPPDDCPAEMQPHLDRLLTVTEIAHMVCRNARSMRKEHKEPWGEPDEPPAGSRPAKWKLRRILPALQKQVEMKVFPKLREPPTEE